MIRRWGLPRVRAFAFVRVLGIAAIASVAELVRRLRHNVSLKENAGSNPAAGESVTTVTSPIPSAYYLHHIETRRRRREREKGADQ